MISKTKKPKFKRTDSNKYNFKNKWRKPRGLHNKLRLKKKGHQKVPAVGYGSPKDKRGLTKEGLRPKLIFTIKDLEKLSKKDTGVISSSLGTKKKIELLEKANELNLNISNVKDINKFIEEKKAQIESRKKSRTKKKEKQKKTKEESIKKAEEKKEQEKAKDTEKEKKEILESKPKQVETPQSIGPKVGTTSQKTGHKQSSIPGPRQ